MYVQPNQCDIPEDKLKALNEEAKEVNFQVCYGELLVACEWHALCWVQQTEDNCQGASFSKTQWKRRALYKVPVPCDRNISLIWFKSLSSSQLLISEQKPDTNKPYSVILLLTVRSDTPNREANFGHVKCKLRRCSICSLRISNLGQPLCDCLGSKIGK